MADETFHRPLEQLRELFLFKQNGEAVEAVNTIMAALDTDPKVFVLSREEVEQLYKYFLNAGYISREFHDEVHKIIDRMAEFINKNRRR